jgi:hypothetical protein
MGAEWLWAAILMVNMNAVPRQDGTRDRYLRSAAMPKVWFGPAEATFRMAPSGDPFDRAQNDVRVRFTDGAGREYERIAFYLGDGRYRAVLVAPQAGDFTATLWRNGRRAPGQPEEAAIIARAPLRDGFLRRSGAFPNRLAWDSGRTYYPVGMNLAWGNEKVPDLTAAMRAMDAAGLNWARIWANHWDGKNPIWDKNSLNPAALAKWDALVQFAPIPFQFVLFHHGQFSTRVNPNWAEHPWNRANGGFLVNPADFFTDPEAKRRTKMYLRQAVARYAHSPNLLAWELFNEVEWTDARYADRWADIAEWHAEMAAYLRSIDPYRHLITTSSYTEEPALWSAMDIVQPHTYPSDLDAAIRGVANPGDKPLLFGEYGPGGNAPHTTRMLADGTLAGVFANHAGAGQYWFWDIAAPGTPLFADLARLARIVRESGVAERPLASPLNLAVGGNQRAALSFRPAGGWGPSALAQFDVPRDAVPAKLRGLSEYLQGRAHPSLQVKPELRFTLSQPGTAILRLATIAKSGAEVVVTVNGEERVRRAFPTAAADSPGSTIEIPLPVGPVRLQIQNEGPDWVRIASLEIPDLAPAVRAIGLAQGAWAMIRLTGPAGGVTLEGLSLPAGRYVARQYSIGRDSLNESTIEVNAGRGSVTTLDDDAVIVLTPAPPAR